MGERRDSILRSCEFILGSAKLILPFAASVHFIFRQANRKMTKDHLTKIKIMADYGDAYAWDQEGVCIGLSYNFPYQEVIAQIEKELEEWAGWFMLNDKDLNFPWDDFNEKGLALAKRLKEAIRDTGIPVFYEPPFEDPNRMNHEVLEIE